MDVCVIYVTCLVSNGSIWQPCEYACAWSSHGVASRKRARVSQKRLNVARVFSNEWPLHKTPSRTLNARVVTPNRCLRDSAILSVRIYFSLAAPLQRFYMASLCTKYTAVGD